ncbi:MAG: DUF4040 domain-containing protein [Merismopedia sp. SIO2A8]|nr:DUF4040 domain-containing protein [Merismopedia sp. SIO2A8]
MFELFQNDDFLIIPIVLLLPLIAGLLVSQNNLYHALVIRGILGAVASLIYALLGAADVALTEALVGTMLSMALYVIAVRSSVRSSVKMQPNTMGVDGSVNLDEPRPPSHRPSANSPSTHRPSMSTKLASTNNLSDSGGTYPEETSS